MKLISKVKIQSKQFLKRFSTDFFMLGNNKHSKWTVKVIISLALNVEHECKIAYSWILYKVKWSVYKCFVSIWPITPELSVLNVSNIKYEFAQINQLAQNTKRKLKLKFNSISIAHFKMEGLTRFNRLLCFQTTKPFNLYNVKTLYWIKLENGICWCKKYKGDGVHIF